MSSLRKQKYYTPEEYLELERITESRNEYFDGEIYAKSGSSLQHSIISVNLISELRLKLRGTDCQALDKDLKIGAKSSLFFYYPDASVVCGKPVFRDQKQDVCSNPSVIFEVLSPSTEAQDRGRKFIQNQGIESLKDYLLVAQDEPRIELFSKQTDGSWRWTITTGLKSKIHVPSINCTLSLAEIYERIEFPEKRRPITAKAAKSPGKKTAGKRRKK